MPHLRFGQVAKSGGCRKPTEPGGWPSCPNCFDDVDVRLEARIGLKHHRVRAIQLKLESFPFAACWKAELKKTGIMPERLLTAVHKSSVFCITE